LLIRSGGQKSVFFFTFQATPKKHPVFVRVSIWAEILSLDVAKTLLFTAFCSMPLQPQPFSSKTVFA